jgi:hypothetical protein
MTNPIRSRIINEVAESIDIPESAYETAERRYHDIGQWFGRPESRCAVYSPNIYPQGSFRLGTVIKPVNGEGEYDLDIGCRLRDGITKATYTQKQLKHLVGAELEAYRIARRVEESLEEKHRCWRLKYADSIQFHIDTVPSIPETDEQRQIILNSMVRGGASDALSRAVTQHTGAITDNRKPNYDTISPDWKISNSEGYSLWFESRMKLATQLLENRAIQARAAKVDDLPAYRWKSPLQRSVQILKRHRDIMYEESPDNHPISIILTTLAGEAYQGEVEIADALDRILSDMGNKVRPSNPRVPNPVNPAEDFADKWSDPQCRHLRLEEHFKQWLTQAQSDFAAISNARSVESIVALAKEKLGVTLNNDGLEERLGFGASAISTAPKHHTISGTPAKPWRTTL